MKFATMLRNFGLAELIDELAGSRINRVENIVTLRAERCMLMAKLYLAFKADKDRDNVHEVQQVCDGGHLLTVSEVEFDLRRCPSKLRPHLPLPSAKYLRLHWGYFTAQIDGELPHVEDVDKDMVFRSLLRKGEFAENEANGRCTGGEVGSSPNRVV
ncbi:hypothetical protein C8T65DRAFT_645478 [Cerioporus squamosus]|nr:hypothetical protein C8T65DRAFT_645478 [Cerioporus squamosus]